jgi:hypothetical protein
MFTLFVLRWQYPEHLGDPIIFASRCDLKGLSKRKIGDFLGERDDFSQGTLKVLNDNEDSLSNLVSRHVQLS